MEKKTMCFVVTECLGRGDGGDIKIEVEVTDTEIEQMKELVREQGETRTISPITVPDCSRKLRRSFRMRKKAMT